MPIPFTFPNDDTITVGKLKALLGGYPDDTPVIMSRDSEGNGFSPVAEVTESMYLAESGSSGETYPTQLQYDEAPDEWDPAPDEASFVLLMWPIR